MYCAGVSSNGIPFIQSFVTIGQEFQKFRCGTCRQNGDLRYNSSLFGHSSHTYHTNTVRACEYMQVCKCACTHTHTYIHNRI